MNRCFACSRWPLLAVFALVASAALLPRGSYAQSREFDDWAGFKAGAWAEIRTKAINLDKQGNETSNSTTRTRVTVESSTENEIKLRIATTVDYEGKQFEAPTNTIVLRPNGQTAEETATTTELPKEKLALEASSFECRVQKAELSSPAGRRTVTSYFRDAAPHEPLRRSVEFVDAEGNPVYTIASEVVALGLPHAVGERVHQASMVKTVFKNHKAASTTWAVNCAEIPGQTAQSSTKEFDSAGVLQKLTFQEVVDYGLPSEATRGTTIRQRIKQRRDERRSRS